MRDAMVKAFLKQEISSNNCMFEIIGALRAKYCPEVLEMTVNESARSFFS